MIWIDVFEALAGYDTSSPAAMGSHDHVLHFRAFQDHFPVLHVAPVCTDGDLECPLQAFENFTVSH